MPFPRTPASVRLAKQTRQLGPDDCWPFVGSIKSNGYGQIRTDNETNGYAHRVAYETHIGPIPEGMTVDHLCHTAECLDGERCMHRRCVNPAHLGLDTRVGTFLRTARKTHCKRGHEFPQGRTTGKVRCPVCTLAMRKREAERRWPGGLPDRRKTIPDAVKQDIRAKVGGGEWTQADAARAYGLKSQSVSRIVSGRRDHRGAQHIPRGVRFAVRERERNTCFRCGAAPGENGRMNVHHRLPRGAGGTSDPATNSLSNLVLLCGSGTEGCHGYIESHRTEAYEKGFLVHRGITDPATVPILRHGRMWTLLRPDGTYGVSPEVEPW